MPLPRFRWLRQGVEHKKGPARGGARGLVSGLPESIADETAIRATERRISRSDARGAGL
jgi:hypothetical protein